MAEEIVSPVEAVRARLQAEIDAQLGALAAQHQQAVDAARQAVERELDERWSTRLNAVQQEAVEAAISRQEMEQVLAANREEMLVAQREQARSDDTPAILTALSAIDSANTASETLHAILRAAARVAPRTALLVSQQAVTSDSNQGQLIPWTTDGVPSLSLEALRPGMVAVPLMLDGVSVAVLYGDDQGAAKSDGGISTNPSWPERLQLIAGIGATRLGYLTAVRTVQAMRWRPPEAPAAAATNTSAATSPTSTSDEEEQAAKRYARLLVSEIKLYNEAAVRTGREHRDLLRRLHPEIDRARRLYEQRIPATVRRRIQLFDHELVQTLAGGDALLLG
ncbi:MAG: hypothetical protein ABIS06_04795 [Vicinamibacterales bacterium]